MGKGSRRNPRERICRDAHGLVEEVAKHGKNGKQRRARRRSLSGWSLLTLKYLYEDRKITASGHETTDTDPGIATTKDYYSLETYILSTDHYQIELLTNLDQVPEAGGIAVVSFPKPKGRPGFPARVSAIVP